MKRIVKKSTVHKNSATTNTLLTIIPADIRNAMWIEAKDVLIWELTKDGEKMTLNVKKEE